MQKRAKAHTTSPSLSNPKKTLDSLCSAAEQDCLLLRVLAPKFGVQKFFAPLFFYYFETHKTQSVRR